MRRHRPRKAHSTSHALCVNAASARAATIGGDVCSFGSPHNVSRHWDFCCLPGALNCIQCSSSAGTRIGQHRQDTLDHLVAEQTPGGLNEQVPSLDSRHRRVHRAGYALSCMRAMSAMSACCTVFRRCSANSPRQERTKPFPTRSTALLRAFSNGKRPSSRRAPTPQRPMEVAIDFFRRELRGS